MLSTRSKRLELKNRIVLNRSRKDLLASMLKFFKLRSPNIRRNFRKGQLRNINKDK